jgi:hypothetical protein
MNGQQLAMNNAAGGPVGAPPMNADQSNEMKMELNTYIYDHLMQSKQYDLARDFRANNPVKTRPRGKPNGVGPDDSKDGPRRPDDLPDANVLPFQGNGSFLMEWWTMFWDLFASARSRQGNGISQVYLKQQRLRHQMMSQDPKMMAGKPGMIPRGVNPQAAMMQQKMMAGQQMQRDPSQMEMGGQGPQTPGQSMDNAPSPSKRPRLDNGGFEGGMAGRPQMAMAANGQLIQNGMNPQQMNSFAPGANGQLKMEVCRPNLFGLY